MESKQLLENAAKSKGLSVEYNQKIQGELGDISIKISNKDVVICEHCSNYNDFFTKHEKALMEAFDSICNFAIVSGFVAILDKVEQ